MNIYQQIADLQLKNKLLLEDANSLSITSLHSNALFTGFIKTVILYAPHEIIDFTHPESENNDIIKQLLDGDLNADEAAAQSNSIWIAFINKLRGPGEVKINTTKFKNTLPDFLTI